LEREEKDGGKEKERERERKRSRKLEKILSEFSNNF